MEGGDTVAADPDVAQIGDPINQPGLIEVGCQNISADYVATLSSLTTLNTSYNVDAAIAEAMAFAVLSVVFGYLLAQTTARFFAETALWSGITVNYSSMAGVAAMVLVIIVVLVSVIYPSRVAGQIAIPDVNRSWTLPPAVGNQMQLTLPFLMTYKEHRSIGGFLYDYFLGHQDVSHGMFSTADVQFGFIDHAPPETAPDDDLHPEEKQPIPECLEIRSSVWLAPFDFGIMQAVQLQFRPAEDEPGFLEIHVRLTRLSGEANAWRRINKTFLHVVRRQLLVWRSFDDQNKLFYEQLLKNAEKNQAPEHRPENRKNHPSRPGKS